MAGQQPTGAVSAAFPAPPPFYKHFTEQNLARLKELQESQLGSEPATDDPSNNSTKVPSASAHPLTDLPPELRYLIPPSPPPSGEYKSFGDHYNISATVPSLSAQGIPQLYPSPPTPLHLRHITRSLLLNFLEFTHILATNPADYGAKWDDLRDLFLNAHHLINEYRPHQARESLILLMEEQVRRGREEVRGVREVKAKVEGILEGLEDTGKEGLGELERVGHEGRKTMEEIRGERRRGEERTVWEIINRNVP
ncbi:Mediator of RNA polymerase II transcription subunit 7 [Hypocenomyce scalaris]|nr:Mediator of RNA polymerase II transcription subunit 7 [Hypocenomyce scalaris]